MEEIMMQYIVKVANPNYRVGREGHKVIAYVIHRPEGTLPGVTDYLADPATQKSYHYIVALDGRVLELVDPENEAWACGVVDNPTWSPANQGINPNYLTINISLEGFAVDQFTHIQLASLFKLIADLESVYHCGIDYNTIIFHREIDAGKSCPGFILNKTDIIEGVDYIINARNIALKAGVLPDPVN